MSHSTTLVRLLTASSETGWASWPEFREAAEGLPERCHYIFHISHVGSTLLSRLVGLHPKLFSLREPVILRFLADVDLALGQPNCPWNGEELAERLGVYLRVWSRTFEPQQTAVIKATSFVCELAERLLERQPAARAVAMFVSPLVFMQALLGGAMSDITGLALDTANNAKLIRELEGVELSEKGIKAHLRFPFAARYVCAAAYVDRLGELTAGGQTTGVIIREPRGSNGFGYDPYFQSEAVDGTFGEATMEQKSRVSHRGRAFRALIEAGAMGFAL